MLFAVAADAAKLNGLDPVTETPPGALLRVDRPNMRASSFEPTRGCLDPT
jgi:hypothetical protein